MCQKKYRLTPATIILLESQKLGQKQASKTKNQAKKLSINLYIRYIVWSDTDWLTPIGSPVRLIASGLNS